MLSIKATCWSVLALVFLIIPELSHGAEAVKTYQFTGSVVRTGTNTITVQRGTDEAQFSRPKYLGNVHRGERVTIVYEMKAMQIKPATQAPGKAAPDQKIILDDRAFYNARNQAHTKPGNHG